MGKPSVVFVIRLLCVPALLAVLFVAAVQPEVPVPEGWAGVEEAVTKGLPKTAIERLEPLLAQAAAAQDAPGYVRALARKLDLETRIEGNQPDERITRLAAEIDSAPAVARPLLRALLAQSYWIYFQHNRWRFAQRTQMQNGGEAEGAPDDFRTWDLRRILAEIHRRFDEALAEREALRAVPIGDWTPFLAPGHAPDACRPTLYDFIAFEALAFYAAGEQAGTQAEDAFEPDADSPLLDPLDAFLAWAPGTTDSASPRLRAVRLLQEVLQFHLRDNDPAALLDAELRRWEYAKDAAPGATRDARYRAGLEGLMVRCGEHETAARVRAVLAQHLRGEGKLVEAHAVAAQGLREHPQSVGGAQCENLMRELEQPAASVLSERVWGPSGAEIAVTYRNLTNVWLRLVTTSFDERVADTQGGFEQASDSARKALLARKPVREWTAALPPTPDYAERTERFPAPADLKPGLYFLLSSYDADWGEKENQVQATAVWVTRLAAVTRIAQGDGALEALVVDGETGEPRAGVAVEGWQRRDGHRWALAVTAETDADGVARLPSTKDRGSLLLRCRDDGQELVGGQEYWTHVWNREERAQDNTVFFTDRALYRPGQTVQYKGVSYRWHQAQDRYAVLPGVEVTVVFQDANGKEIEKQQHRTNAQGSFNGSVTAPRDRAMGSMQLIVQSGPGGSTRVQVEEYKRPKFQAAIEAPAEPARLGGDVTVRGKATAYTGAAIGGAKVRYRVVRAVRYPDWWGWRYWWRQPVSGGREIAHGRAVTAADGSFEVRFVAHPDPTVDPEEEPVFQYTVNADVTDPAGETRSAQRVVQVGYTALRATVNADEWQTPARPVVLRLQSTTHDGQGAAAKGRLEVHALRQPEAVERPALSGGGWNPYMWGGVGKPASDPANWKSWESAKVVESRQVETQADGATAVEVELPPGAYRATWETADRFGKAVRAEIPLLVVDPQGTTFPVRIAHHFAAPAWSVEAGETFLCLWGTGYATGRAYVEIEHRGKILKAWWTAVGATQEAVEWPVTEGMRGGFTVHVTQVRDNRAHTQSRRVDVPWSNKRLALSWERFTSKLGPGEEDRWSFRVSGAAGETDLLEAVGALYDASLDAYLAHGWRGGFGVFRTDHSRRTTVFENRAAQLVHWHGHWALAQRETPWSYRAYPQEWLSPPMAFYRLSRRGGMAGGMMPSRAEATAMDAAGDGAPMAMAAAPGAPDVAYSGIPMESMKAAGDERADAEAGEGLAQQADAPPLPDLDKVTARKNLQETAFFFPHLTVDPEGRVEFTFTMPEALTEWRFLGFAHGAGLAAGMLEGRTVTSKDLMVEPNAPRFVREGDEIEFTVKVSNQSPARQTGVVRLELADARTLASVHAAVGLDDTVRRFDIPSMESQVLAWRIRIPDGLAFLTYKAVGATDRLSDGEEGYLPVLSRRIPVTESLPLPIRGAQTKTFAFAKLLESAKSDTLRHTGLTVQMVSQPAWYAVLALPYLMEYPHECMEQTFNRYYANALAQSIAGSDPKIRRIFDQWKGTDALDSPLEKNEELKALALLETPWVRQADSESQARRNVGVLFDANRLQDEQGRALRRLTEGQLGDGRWSWFPGGGGNDYITLYIVTGFGRLRHLGAKADVAPAVKALARLDAWVDEQYREILRHRKPDENHLNTTVALYLYARSFFLNDLPIAPQPREAVEYFLGQARQYWLQLGERQSQAHLALALKRFGDAPAARGIVDSLRERSVSSEEMGMFWRDTELSWWWYRAPIESQAMMIEAFDEVAGDAAAVEACRVWLLKQKQTQDWKTTKATADAVYGLLLRGGNLLASDALVEVELAGQPVKPEKVEAGTGFYEQRIAGAEVRPAMGTVTVRKTDGGVSWGSVHWQYLEDIAKVTGHTATPLTLHKRLFVREHTKSGPSLRPVSGALAVGDELVTRLELRVDRDMEYVFLKDQRGSGTEPVEVLSQYRYQDGLAYYQSTRDTATHFFIDYLPKGTYVFEYAVRVAHRGQYPSGIAEIQSLYAPEFNSHSASTPLVVE